MTIHLAVAVVVAAVAAMTGPALAHDIPHAVLTCNLQTLLL